nr:MAG: hypothetical protein 1 [Hubei sediment noda-like virus 8]
MKSVFKLPSVALATELRVGYPAQGSFQPLGKELMKFTCRLGGGVAACMACYCTYRGLRYVYLNPSVVSEWLRSLIGDRLFSLLLQWCSTPLSPDRRKLFREVTLDCRMAASEQPTHSHPAAAQYRGVANAMMENFSIMLGKPLYSVSCSRSEQDHTAGSRLFHFAKDLQQNYKFDRLGRDSIIKMTDVDYYVNMPEYLKGNDVLLYTFVPQAVAGTTCNGSYRVLPNNQVETHINGGANYVHPIWDYETDHIIVRHWWGCSFYLVEQKILSKDRRLIYLNYIRSVYGPLGWILPGYELKHRQMVFGDMAYVKFMEGGQEPVVKHSFAALHDYTTAVVEDKTLITVRTRLMHATKPTMSDVERVLRSQDVSQPDVVAGILYLAMMDPLLSKLLISNPNYPITKFERGDNVYTPLGKNVLEDGKPTMRKITEPFMLDAAHPSRSQNSDEACLQGRIHNVKNPVKKVPPFYYQCLKEFATFTVPDHLANTLVPEDYNFIRESWNRPSQRALLDRVKHVLFMNKPCAVKSFQKAEAYAKVTHPRNISTLPTGHNARLGQYVYVFSNQVMKTQHWYAFGKHPSEVAEIVHTKTAKSTTAIPTDISKLDGSGGPFHTDIETAVLVRAFAEPYKEELHALIKREAHINGFTSFGLHYLAENQTLSGSSKTSVRNTLITACVSYIAYRCYGLAPKEAYAALGIYGGDDGINYDIDPVQITKVFAKTGLVLKADVVRMGSPVPFLGRYFLDPWTCTHSIADVPRQLRKLHLTASPSTVPRDVVLKRRAEAILITDPETPILSDWAKAVLRIVKVTQREAERYANLTACDVSYWSKYASPFPPSGNKPLVDAVVSDMFNGNLKVLFLIARLNAATTIEDMTFLVDDTPPKIEVDATLQGVLHKAPKVKTHQQILKANQKLPTRAKPTSEPNSVARAWAKPGINTTSPTPGRTQQRPNKAVGPNKREADTSMVPRPSPRTAKVPSGMTTSSPQQPASRTPRAMCRYITAGQPCPNLQCRFRHQ